MPPHLESAGKGVPGSWFISFTPRKFFSTSGTPPQVVKCVSGATIKVTVAAEAERAARRRKEDARISLVKHSSVSVNDEIGRRRMHA
jgi:hypothetical protein